MALLTTDSSLSDVLENRYISSHVGGAFDAKIISKPKSVDQALKDATFGRKYEESLMLEGQDTTRYVKYDEIIPEVKPQPSFLTPSFRSKPVKASTGPSRLPVIKAIIPGQFVKQKIISPVVEPKPLLRPQASTTTITPGQFAKQKIITAVVEPKPLLRPQTSAVTITPGQFAKQKIISPVVEPNPVLRQQELFGTVTPGQFIKHKIVSPVIQPNSFLRTPMLIPAVVPGQPIGFITMIEPSGNGRPGTPFPSPFIPTPPLPFGPLMEIPVPIAPIYWNTDPDIWDYAKLIGQTYWDS